MANAVSDSTFEQEVLKSPQPVLVDFFAEWCGPCKAMAPALEQVAQEMAGKVKIVKLDVDQNPTVTGKYGIRAMPTLMIFKDGQVAATKVGVRHRQSHACRRPPQPVRPDLLCRLDALIVAHGRPPLLLSSPCCSVGPR